MVKWSLNFFIMIIIGTFIFCMLFIIAETGSGRTLTVDDSGGANFTSIRDALDAAEDGDTIRVFAGKYEERIHVNRSVDIIGNGSSNTIIDGGGTGDVVLITAHWVNISGFSMTNSGIKQGDAGITIFSNHTSIMDNNCSYNGRNGINIEYGGNNSILGNTCSNNGKQGIIPLYANFTTIANNTCSSNINYGISNYRSHDNTIVNNTCSFNSLSGISLYYSNQNTCSGNTLSSNIEQGIRLRGSDRNIVTGNTCSWNGENGIILDLSHENALSYNSFMNNDQAGIDIENSDDNLITNNTITGNSPGIHITLSSEQNKAFYNDIYNNTNHGIDASDNSGDTINATYNWWGTPTGPYHPVMNPRGTGDNVSDHVFFDPWLGKINDPGIEGPVWYVDDDSTPGGDGSILHPYNTIQDAVNAAGKGGTIYVYSGSYFENIELTSRVRLLGENASTTFIDGSDQGTVISVLADGISIENLTIMHSNFTIPGMSGVLVRASCQIINNILMENRNAILVQWPGPPSGKEDEVIHIAHNTIHHNQWGVNLQPNSTSLVEDCVFHDNIAGIQIWECDGNKIMNNDLRNNYFGVEVSGSNDNLLLNNTCNMNNGYGVLVIDSQHNTLSGNTVMGNKVGIFIYGDSWSNLIYDNNIYGNIEYGINTTDTLNFTINARDNWWGNKSGPYHPGKNPEGRGDKVGDHIDFYPWVGKEIGPGERRVWYVDDDALPDGDGSRKMPFICIRYAISAAKDGDTIFVEEGVYDEHVTIKKSLTLTGSGPEHTTILENPSGYGVYIDADWTNISGFSLSNDRNPLMKGIYVVSDHCCIFENDITAWKTGICLQYCTETMIAHNRMVGCGISIREYSPGHYSSHLIDPTNTVDGKSVYYYVNASDITVPSDAGQVFFANCSSMRVEGQNLSNIPVGVLAWNSSFITITNNTCSDNEMSGIDLEWSNNNYISNNTCFSNEISGIRLYASDDNVITNNTCTMNRYYGIPLTLSDHNTLSNNICTGSAYSGILIFYLSDHNTITSNNCSMNSYGISILYSSDNVMTYNIILDNTVGIRLEERGSGNGTLWSFIMDRKFDLVAVKVSSGNGTLWSFISMNNTAQFNVISGNQLGIDVRNNGGHGIDATKNYWGSDSGPYHPEDNPHGEGDTISDHVNFSPWLDEHGNLRYLKNDEKNDPSAIIIAILWIMMGISLTMVMLLLISVFRFRDTEKDPVQFSPGKKGR